MNLEKMNPYSWIKKFNSWLDNQNALLQAFVMLSLIFIIRTFVFGLYWVPTGSMEPTILVGESFLADKFTPLFTKIKRGDIVSFNDPTYVYSDNYLIKLFEKYCWGPDNWTKRVIGIPGDHVEGKVINGVTYIYLNGQELDEPYINPYPIVKVKEESWQWSMTFPGIGNTPHNSIPFFKKTTSSHYRVFDPQFPIDSLDQPFYPLYLEEKLPNNIHPSILYPRTPVQTGSVSDVFDVYLGENDYWCMGDNRLGSYDSRAFGCVSKEYIHGKIVLRLFSFNSSNSIVYNLLVVPLINTYNYLKLLTRSWKRWFCKIQ